jgi:hypothetical protein
MDVHERRERETGSREGPAEIPGSGSASPKSAQ